MSHHFPLTLSKYTNPDFRNGIWHEMETDIGFVSLAFVGFNIRSEQTFGDVRSSTTMTEFGTRRVFVTWEWGRTQYNIYVVTK